MGIKMEKFNIMGPADLVSETIQHFKNGQERIVTDVFPTKDPTQRDVNVTIIDERVDEFYEWCEARETKGLVFKMI